MKADLVVIGAGPAGLSAAIRAATFGAKVIVVDENARAGGKLLGQLHEEPGQGWWIGRDIALRLERQARSLGVSLVQEREVWGLFPGWQVMLNRGERLQAPFVLLATGAVERPLPVPGWTLPGVMAVGAAQVLANVYRVRPGNRVLLVGVDALSVTVARELAMAGADVVGIVLPPAGLFSGQKSSPRFLLSYLGGMAKMAPTPALRLGGRLLKSRLGLRWGARFYPRRGVRLWNVPLMLRTSLLEVCGTERVESVRVADVTPEGTVIAGTERTWEVDAVCLSGGLYPLAELAAAAGCHFVHIADLGGAVPLHGPCMETSADGLFVAGNITGIEGARVAIAQGELAGLAVAARLRLLPPEQQANLLAQAAQEVKKVRKSAGIHFLPHVEKGRKTMEALWSQAFPDRA